MKFVDIINEKLGVGVGLLVLVMAFVIAFEIVSRNLFDAPTIWAHETAQLAFATYVILSGAYTHRRLGHVRVDVLYNIFPPRGRVLADWLACGLFSLFCAVLIFWGGVMAWKAIINLETSTTPFGPILYPFKAMIPLAALLLLLQGVSNLRRGS